MVSNGKDLYKLLDQIFEFYGYIRKKDTYYIYTAECICFFSIGKSSLGGHYDHVMGCFLKEIIKEKEEFPMYNKNHLKYSLRELADKALVKRIFDLEDKSFMDEQRERIIRELIEKKAIEFLNDVSSKAGIIRAVSKYRDLIYYIKGDLFTHLNLSLPE